MHGYTVLCYVDMCASSATDSLQCPTDGSSGTSDADSQDGSSGQIYQCPEFPPGATCSAFTGAAAVTVSLGCILSRSICSKATMPSMDQAAHKNGSVSDVCAHVMNSCHSKLLKCMHVAYTTYKGGVSCSVVRPSCLCHPSLSIRCSPDIMDMAVSGLCADESVCTTVDKLSCRAGQLAAMLCEYALLHSLLLALLPACCRLILHGVVCHRRVLITTILQCPCPRGCFRSVSLLNNRIVLNNNWCLCNTQSCRISLHCRLW